MSFRILKQAEDPKEAAKGILARAAARGIGIVAGVPELSKVMQNARSSKKKKLKKESVGKSKLAKSRNKTTKSMQKMKSVGIIIVSSKIS